MGNKIGKSKNWKDINGLIEYPKSGILSKELSKGGRMNITLFCMAKGTELSEHTSTKEGFIYILEGKGIFNLEGEKIPMQKGICIFMERDAVHSLKAEQNTSFILSLCGE